MRIMQDSAIDVLQNSKKLSTSLTLESFRIHNLVEMELFRTAKTYW